MEEQVQGHDVAVSNSLALYSVDFIAGLFGGWAGLLVGHPFDTIKVRQQTQWQGCRTLVQCVRTTLKVDGMRGFYRGMAFPLVSVGILNSIFFGVYGNSLRMLGKLGEASGSRSKEGREMDHAYGTILLAGAFGGAVQAIPASPIELVKIKLQSATGKDSSYSAAWNRSSMTVKQGPMQQLHAVYKHGGVPGVFRGLTLTVLREVPGFGVYVVVYEWCTRSMRVEGEKTPHVGYLLAAGGFAGMTSWFANIPIDIVKSCIQSDDIVRPRYRGMRDCALQLYRNDGVRAFWRGLPAVCIRAFPCNAVTFAVYTTTTNLLMDWLEFVD